MKLFYEYTVIFFNFPPTSNHLHPLQVENCDSDSRLVVDGDGNGKFRPERVKLALDQRFEFAGMLMIAATKTVQYIKRVVLQVNSLRRWPNSKPTLGQRFVLDACLAWCVLIASIRFFFPASGDISSRAPEYPVNICRRGCIYSEKTQGVKPLQCWNILCIFIINHGDF